MRTTRPLVTLGVLLALILLIAWCLGGGRDPDAAAPFEEETRRPHEAGQASPQAMIPLAGTTDDEAVAAPLVNAAGEAAEAALVSRNLPYVKGRILAGDDPVENVYVYAMQDGVGGWAQQYTPPSGEYEIEMPRDGQFEVCAAPASGRRSGWGEFMVTVGWNEVKEFDVQLGRCGLAGVLRDDSTSALLVDVTVKATGKDQNGQTLSVGARTDAEGRFRIQPLLPGTYSLQIEGRTYLSPPTEPFTLTEEAPRRDIELRGSPQRAELRVDVDFDPRQDRYGLVIEIEGPWSQKQKADARAGWWRFEVLQPGSYAVRLRRGISDPLNPEPGEVLVEKTVELGTGDSAAVELVVPRDG